MKKIKSIILCAILLCCVCGCEKQKDKESSLIGYIKEQNLKLYGNNETFSCNLLSEIQSDDIKEIASFISQKNYVVILTNNYYLKLYLDGKQKFSNNQNCIKADYDFSLNKVIRSYENYYAISNDKKLYRLSIDIKDELNNLFDSSFKELNIESYEKFILQENLKQILVEDDFYENGFFSNYVKLILKEDGIIYKQIFDRNYNFISENIYFNNQEYGNIKSAMYGSFYYSENGNYQYLLTNDDLYFYTYKNKEDCEKYVDIVCQKELIKSPIYSKYKKDIIFLGKEYSLLKGGYLIKNDILF